MKKKIALLLMITALLFNAAHAIVRLPQIIRDSMILQRDIPVKLWGWSAINEKIQIRFNNKTYITHGNALREWNDIHPDRKKEVGERLALAAVKLAYKEDIVFSAPQVKNTTIQGHTIRMEFDHVGSGLMTNDGKAPAEWAIAGADKKFVWAKAKIAWANNPVQPNLYNREGLRASPFRTDK